MVRIMPGLSDYRPLKRTAQSLMKNLNTGWEEGKATPVTGREGP
jgi:hypothetical protein